MAKSRPKTITKVIKPGRIHAVLATLGSEIARDVIPVGATLPPEPELEARFGVGRGVVREAIKTLAAKGLVEVRAGGGAHVRQPSSGMVSDALSLVLRATPDGSGLSHLREVRRVVEPDLTALAAERRDANQVRGADLIAIQLGQPIDRV